MHVPTLHLRPQPLCGTTHPVVLSSPLSCDAAPTLWDTPPIVRVPVVDDLGIEYGVDLQVTEGAYVLLAVLVFWVLVVRPAILDFVRRRRE